MPSATVDRRALIRSLLRERPVHSQAELSQLLEERGCPVSQPVLSRDLRALQVAKVGGAYHVLESETVTPLEALRSMLRGASAPRQWILVQCEPGAASAVARALEAEAIDGVLGTLAGDDTVLVGLASEAAAASVRRRVAELTARR
jgi:transcriptional regulator of arginine metabolism